MGPGINSSTQIALSERSRGSRYAGLAFFSLFFVAGIATSFPYLIVPLSRVVAARNWTQTQCRILSVRVGEASGDESVTYRPVIRYRYRFAGKYYESDRYGPITFWTSARSYATDAVRPYSPGRAATCYVNPRDPAQAMLTRDPHWRPMTAAVIPISFTLIGGIGAMVSLRRVRSASSPLGGSGLPSTGRASAQALRAKQGPVASLAVMLVLALFWNGIISFFIYDVARSYARGSSYVCMTIFLVPFAAAGAALIVGVCYSFLRLFNPRPEVALSRTPLRPGESSDVRWRFHGRFDRISRLTIHVEGREEATYRRGSDSVTDKSIFFRETIADTGKAFEIASGVARLSIPPRTMHTFSSNNNKIIWELQLHGDIAGWPDVKEQFVLVVLPAEARS